MELLTAAEWGSAASPSPGMSEPGGSPASASAVRCSLYHCVSSGVPVEASGVPGVTPYPAARQGCRHPASCTGLCSSPACNAHIRPLLGPDQLPASSRSVPASRPPISAPGPTRPRRCSAHPGEAQSRRGAGGAGWDRRGCPSLRLQPELEGRSSPPAGQESGLRSRALACPWRHQGPRCRPWPLMPPSPSSLISLSPAPVSRSAIMRT